MNSNSNNESPSISEASTFYTKGESLQLPEVDNTDGGNAATVATTNSTYSTNNDSNCSANNNNYRYKKRRKISNGTSENAVEKNNIDVDSSKEKKETTTNININNSKSSIENIGIKIVSTDDEFKNLLYHDDMNTWKSILFTLTQRTDFDHYFQSNTNNATTEQHQQVICSNVLSRILMSRNVDTFTRLHTFRKLLSINKQLARCKHGNSLPIHHVVRNFGRIESSSKQDIINLLIEAFPEGLIIGDMFGQTPLHIACCRGSSVKEIKALLIANERAATIKDNTGNLPIHIALCRKCTPDKFKALYNAYPESLLVENNRGFNPIDLASNDQTGKQSNACLIDCLKKLFEEAQNGAEGNQRVMDIFAPTNKTGKADNTKSGKLKQPDVALDKNGSEDNQQENGVEIGMFSYDGRNTNLSSLPVEASKMPPPELDIVTNQNSLDGNRQRVIEMLASTYRARNTSSRQAPEPEPNEVVDLVDSSDDDKESSTTNQNIREDEDEPRPDSPIGNEINASFSTKNALHSRDCITNGQVRPSSLPPMQQQSDSPSFHQQGVTLDRHRLAAIQAALEAQIAIHAGTQIISLPQAVAAIPQNTSLAQSPSFGLLSTSTGAPATNVTAAQYQLQQQQAIQQQQTIQQKYDQQRIAKIIQDEQNNFKKQISEQNECHDKLVEDIVKSCEHTLGFINEAEKEKSEVEKQIEEIKKCLEREDSFHDNVIALLSHTKNSATLYKDISVMEDYLVKSEEDQNHGIQTLKRNHMHNLQQLYRKHTGTISISNKIHSNDMLSISKSNQDPKNTNATRFQTLCNNYDRDVGTMHFKIANTEDLMKQAFQQLTADRDSKYALDATLVLLKEKRCLECKRDYLISKLKKQTHLKEREDCEGLNSLLERHASSNSTVTDNTCNLSDIPGNSIIMLLKSDRDRLLEKIKNLKQTMGEDFFLNDSNFSTIDHKMNDLDTTEEVLETYI